MWCNAPEPVIRDTISLLLALDPYCRLCTSRNKILRLHSRSIHEDLETDDFMDDSSLWAYIYPDELPQRRPTC